MRDARSLHFALLSALSALSLAAGALVAQNRNNQPNQPPQEVTTEHYQAVVVSSTDGKPVPRVLVTSFDRRLAVMTDFEGRFAFDFHRPVPPAANSGLQSLQPAFARGFVAMPLQLSLHKPGYVDKQAVLRLPARTPDTPALQIKIVPAGVLTGHVYPESGDLPPGMYVQLRRRQVQDGAATWMQVGSSPINSRGEFRFGNLQPGEYKLMTASQIINRTPPNSFSSLDRSPQPDSIPGLLPSFYPEAANLDSATSISIGPGANVTANLTPRRVTFYHVTIPVASLDPSKGISATLIPEFFAFPIRSNAQTHTIEGYLPTGSYTLRIVTFAPTPIAAMAHIQVAGAPLHAAAINPTGTADIPIIVRRELTGRTNVQPGFQGPSVSVNLQPADLSKGFMNNFTGNGPSKPGDGDDALKLQNVVEGLYRVAVFPRLGYAASVTYGTTDLLREPLSIGASGPSGPIEVTLRDDYATLSGRLLPSTAPQTQSPDDSDIVFVQCIPLDRPESQSLGNAAIWQGQFTMPNLPPGRYLVLASHEQLQNGIEYRNPDVVRDLLSKGTVVTLSANQKTDIQVPLMPEEGN